MSDDIKIGTKLEAQWTEVKEATEKRIEQMEVGLECEKEILKLCERKINNERKK